jgi:hypothetical protein
MKLFNKYSLTALLFTTAMACKKIITVDLNNAAPVLVVQGNITNESGPYAVKLTKSISYSADNDYPAVSSAVVKITDDSTGVVDILTETGKGVYITNATQGNPLHTYHLYIKAEGKEYTAVSTMPKQVLLDSLSFFTTVAFNRKQTNPLPNFQDPLGTYNAYRFLQTTNSTPSKQIFVFNDRLSDGRYISRQLNNDSSYIQSGDTVRLEMQCIDKDNFEYLKELSRRDPTNGQPTSPANPTNLISNGALGYFSAHTVQRVQKVFN